MGGARQSGASPNFFCVEKWQFRPLRPILRPMSATDDDALLEAFARELRVVRRASEHTARAYSSDLRQLREFLAGRDVPMDRANPADLRAFVSSRFGLNDPRSMARKLSAARAF